MGKVGSDLNPLAYCPAVFLRRSIKVSPLSTRPDLDLLTVEASATFSLTSTSSSSADMPSSSSIMHSSTKSSSAAISFALAAGFEKGFLKFRAGGRLLFLVVLCPLAMRM